MDRRLLNPKWLFAHLVVAIVVVVFVNLGFWQLDRLEERRTLNAAIAQGLSREPVPLETLEDEPPGEIEYRKVTVSGEFLAIDEVLIRSRVHRGTAGYHLVTPLSRAGSSAVLINRGWIPLGVETDSPAAPSEPITLEGWIHLTQERPPLGPEDPPGGILDVMSRVDIARIADQVDYPLASVYVVVIGEQGFELPVPVAPPNFDDEGSHLAYAIQWFAFALTVLVGYGFLARRQLRESA